MPHKNHYREKLLEEIQTIPQEMTPVLYKIVHLLNVQWISKKALATFEETIEEGLIIIPTIVLAEVMYICQIKQEPAFFIFS